MLKQKDFYGKTKIDTAIERILQFQPPEGYYLAFSGGKDSVVLKKLTEIAGVRFEPHYNVTTIDPPEVVRFTRQNHSDVIFDRPEKPFLKILQTRGFPTRQGRWCCEVLKECHGSNRKVLTGVRWAESSRRSKTRKLIETCYKDSTKTFLNPIIDWTDAEIWEFISYTNIPYCQLYDLGFKRIGCLFCPMSYYKRRINETKMYPKYTQAFIRSFEILYNNRVKENNDSVKRWKDGESMFWWWINGVPKKNEENNQLHLFP